MNEIEYRNHMNRLEDLKRERIRDGLADQFGRKQRQSILRRAQAFVARIRERSLRDKDAAGGLDRTCQAVCKAQ